MLRSWTTRSTLPRLVAAVLGECGGPSDEEPIRDTFQGRPFAGALVGHEGKTPTFSMSPSLMTFWAKAHPPDDVAAAHGEDDGGEKPVTGLRLR